jgi:hypothetical protein
MIEKFNGNWQLLEWTLESTKGITEYPFGKNALGLITYDMHGNVAVQIMKKDRPLFKSKDPVQAQPEELAVAMSGFIAYCGTYDIDVQSGKVIHHIKISSFTNWVGQDQERYFEFKDDTLILSTDFIGEHKHRLTWKKIS